VQEASINFRADTHRSVLNSFVRLKKIGDGGGWKSRNSNWSSPGTRASFHRGITVQRSKGKLNIILKVNSN